MNITVALLKTDDVPAELTIRGTLAELKELADQLEQKWPSWKLSAAINGAIRKANGSFGEAVTE